MMSSFHVLPQLTPKTNAMSDLSHSIDAWDRIAKYADPMLKAVECYPEEDRVVNVIVKRFDSSLE